MKTLEQQLTLYAAYHQDRRNILTHFIGIPMIVLAVATLLSRPGMQSGGLWLSPALLAGVLAAVYYLLLDLRYGVVMALKLTIFLWFAALLAQLSTAGWLGWGLVLFVLGWIIQFIGHHYEGRKPAFLDDIMGLAIGPLFVVAELGFMFGLRKPLADEIASRLEQ
ncbi:MAG: DUF962 domain-containing protein [Gammaproteobacteria bacterium]|nr:DUF962 domain-containing protein [Gammaproteobacteria bacterium]